MNINRIKGKIRMNTTKDNRYSPIYKKGEYFKYEGGEMVGRIFKVYSGGFYITKVKPITITKFFPIGTSEGMEYSGFFLNKEQENEYLQLLREDKINSILSNRD